MVKPTASHVQSCVLHMRHCRSRPTAHASLQERTSGSWMIYGWKLEDLELVDGKVLLMSLLDHHTDYIAQVFTALHSGLKMAQYV